VESFEAIAENLVMQEGFTRLEVIGDDVTVVGERVSGSSVSHCISIYMLYKHHNKVLLEPSMVFMQYIYILVHEDEYLIVLSCINQDRDT